MEKLSQTNDVYSILKRGNFDTFDSEAASANHSHLVISQTNNSEYVLQNQTNNKPITLNKKSSNISSLIKTDYTNNNNDNNNNNKTDDDYTIHENSIIVSMDISASNGN